MGFMKPYTYVGDLICYEDEDGVESFVDVDWLKDRTAADELREAQGMMLDADGEFSLKAQASLREIFNGWGAINERMPTMTLKPGKHYGRLTADGYMDCTEWYVNDSDEELWDELIAAHGEDILEDAPEHVQTRLKHPERMEGDKYMRSCPRCGARSYNALLELVIIRARIYQHKFDHTNANVDIWPEHIEVVDQEVGCSACGAQDITLDELELKEN